MTLARPQGQNCNMETLEMKGYIPAVFVFLLVALVTGCNDESGGSDSDVDGPSAKSDVNVAAAKNAATTETDHLPEDAVKLIDEDGTTYWQSDVDKPIVVKLSQVERVKSFTLSRINEGSATVGTNPDILVELSSDGSTYEQSGVSVIIGGVPCSSNTLNATTMKCDMADGYDLKSIRVTSKNGKAFKFTELEAIAEK